MPARAAAWTHPPDQPTSERLTAALLREHSGACRGGQRPATARSRPSTHASTTTSSGPCAATTCASPPPARPATTPAATEPPSTSSPPTASHNPSGTPPPASSRTTSAGTPRADQLKARLPAPSPRSSSSATPGRLTAHLRRRLSRARAPFHGLALLRHECADRALRVGDELRRPAKSHLIAHGRECEPNLPARFDPARDGP
jgi:hypothetical protein